MILPPGLFYYPLSVPSKWVLWLILPLCLTVAVVYKTLRTEHLSRLPRAVAMLMVYIVVGLAALGTALWAFQAYWP